MEPVPVVRMRRQTKALNPATLVNLFILRSIIIHR